jgi:thermostable 8-oxoguanine DNA glycosylase
MKPKFKLLVPKNKLQKYYSMYEYDLEELENEVQNEIVPVVKNRGYCTKSEFLKICKWKTRRTQSRCNKNDESFIKEVTRIAFSAKNEKIRIEILTLLEGVNYPTASVFLHFCHQDPYPILDFRALWSLNINNKVNYDFKFWIHYTQYCRDLAVKHNLTMRELDKALWYYSKINEK